MINKTLIAWTSPEPTYPPYFNAAVDGSDVVLTVRAAPEIINGERICGRTCHAGGPHCNNYCNMHPDKSLPMMDHPLLHTFARCGESVSMRMPRAEFEKLISGLAA